MKKRELKRVNINLPQNLCDDYDLIAQEMGVSRSYVMVTALYQYLEQRQIVKTTNHMPAWLNQLEGIAKEVKKHDK